MLQQTITSTLLGLTLPLAGIAMVLGAVAAVRGWLAMHRGQYLRRSPVAERIALFVCALCATAAALSLFGALRADASSILIVALLVQFAFSAAGLAVYFTSRRALAEAFAAVAMGIFSILTGFSVGSLLAPFAVAMGVLATHHLRVERRHSREEI